MNKKFVSITVLLLLLVSTVPISQGNSNGRYSSASGCGGCHGSAGGATVAVSGLPSSYTAGQSYTLTVSVSGGPSGSNGGFSIEVDKGQFSTPGTVSYTHLTLPTILRV